MRRTFLASSCVVIFAATMAIASSAEANGRFPESNQIAFSKNDPDVVILRVTFGLLLSHDRGKTFDWICEQSIGFSGAEDPMYAITPSKKYLATTFQGITISQDQACGWDFAGGDLKNQVFIDLSSNQADTKNIIFFSSSYDKQDPEGGILFVSKIYETKDEGQSFQQLGPNLDPGFLGYTLDFAPSDSQRIYVTVVRDSGSPPPGKAVLLVSKDHGQSFTEEPVPLIGTERAAYIAAVDPTNPERVYLRTSNDVDLPTRLIVRDATDGGPATQKVIFSAKGGLNAFALSPDGAKVWAGGSKDGVNLANTSDFTFQHKSDLLAGCLAVNADGLWACSNELGYPDAGSAQGFIIGLSTDDGATFQSRLHFCDIRGPLDCPATSNSNLRCDSLWPAQKASLGCSDTSSSSGSSGSPTDGGLGDSGDTVVVVPGTKTCGCSTTPVGPWGAFVTSAGVALALLRRSRRKKR